MITKVNGERIINWRWRRRLFRWEEELVEVCQGVVLGIIRSEGDKDCWKWSDSVYSVREAYYCLTSEDLDDTG
ncbi:hypothetical protein A2U01_0028895, partial [Trifolium medium]|nr:hypothetical protein [Trifolium medium]